MAPGRLQLHWLLHPGTSHAIQQDENKTHAKDAPHERPTPTIEGRHRPGLLLIEGRHKSGLSLSETKPRGVSLSSAVRHEQGVARHGGRSSTSRRTARYKYGIARHRGRGSTSCRIATTRSDTTGDRTTTRASIHASLTPSELVSFSVAVALRNAGNASTMRSHWCGHTATQPSKTNPYPTDRWGYSPSA